MGDKGGFLAHPYLFILEVTSKASSFGNQTNIIGQWLKSHSPYDEILKLFCLSEAAHYLHSYGQNKRQQNAQWL